MDSKDHAARMIAFDDQHIIETIQGMAKQLRYYADELERNAARADSRPGNRAHEALGTIRAMNANLRLDVLVSSLDRIISTHETVAAEHAAV